MLSKIKTIILTMGLISLFATSYSQELNCDVTLNTQKVQIQDKQLFENLRSAIYEFMNSRQWTELSFNGNERIECSMSLIISDRNVETNEMKATITVQARRPVYNSSYSSTILNFADKDLTFKYSTYDPLNYSESSVGNDLTATLAYYAYMIIALTFDSFGPEGGSPYFLKAQETVRQAERLGTAGWKSADNNKHSRYWLLDGFFNSNYKSMRNTMYKYHRLGMDMMYENSDEARKVVLSCLEDIQTLKQSRVNLFSIPVFLEAKSEELINIFSLAPEEEKTKFLSLMGYLDPSNMQKYQNINKK